MFSDESHFQLCLDNHQRRVWNRPGQRTDPVFTIARHTGPQPAVMVWSAISFDSRTPLGIIRGTITTRRYVDDILRTVLLPFLLQRPDIYPIELVWDMKGRRLRLPGNVDHLARQLEQIWEEKPQESIRVPYHSMPRRVAACIQARGGSTPY
ncbi:transposable element Tc1 transposase [Trichonephila clavipes]|nr:transposable element Tc1 transposase [Trichonephila clavipes]